MAPFAGYDNMNECKTDHSDKDDPGAYCARVYHEVTGNWPSEKYRKRFADSAVFPTPLEVAEKAVTVGDVPLGMWKQIPTDDFSLLQKFAEVEDDKRRFKKVIDMVKLSRTENVSDVISKADNISKVGFDATINNSVGMVLKQDDEFLIWGPASVEVVDKEQDKISIEALDKALPQLLKRSSLSYNHTDQIVGQILERFETEEPVEVTIDGTTYERSEFPTDVMELDEGHAPALYVAGEIYDDTNQSQTVREKIEEGVINSYSISGEALVTQKQVDGNMVYDNILEMDLSAVTVCEEGMNESSKFARVDGDAEEVVTTEDVEKDFEVSPGSVNATTEEVLAKSMSEKEFNPDEFVKVDSVDGEIASKSYVNDQFGDVVDKSELEEAIDKTVDAISDELEGSVVKEEEFEEKAREIVNSVLPKGDLVTRSYIEEVFNEKEDHDDEDKDYEDKEDDGGEAEEMEGEEEEDEEHDEEEAEAEEAEDNGEDKKYSADELQEELPGDVWSVVTEYIPDTKREKSEEQPEEITESDLEKAVRTVMSGQQVQSPGTSLEDRADELDELYKEDGDEVEGSPALDKWS